MGLCVGSKQSQVWREDWRLAYLTEDFPSLQNSTDRLLPPPLLHTFQISSDPLRVRIEHLKDDFYTNNDILKVRGRGCRGGDTPQVDHSVR